MPGGTARCPVAPPPQPHLQDLDVGVQRAQEAQDQRHELQQLLPVDALHRHHPDQHRRQYGDGGKPELRKQNEGGRMQRAYGQLVDGQQRAVGCGIVQQDLRAEGGLGGGEAELGDPACATPA